MPLDAANATDPSLELAAAFALLGGGAPASRGSRRGRRGEAAEDPRAAAAYEYWAASLLLRLAEARREKAKRAAVAEGVLPDHAANPFPIGTVDLVYVGDVVTIGVKVVAQADKVNTPNLVAELERAGVKPATLKRLVKKHTEHFPGAHVFTASLTAG